MDWPPEKLNKYEAEFVKHLRCGPIMYSWRAIAAECANAWGGTWGENQIAGKDLCEAAAKYFGEDPNSEPWN